MLNDSLKKCFFLLFLSLFVSGLYAWTDQEEEAELDRLIRQFNESIDIKRTLEKFNESYYEILNVNEVLSNPEQEEKLIRIFSDRFKPVQNNVKEFADEFHKLGEMFSLASVYRRFKCLEYEVEAYALYQTMQMAFERLEQYTKNKTPLPPYKFDNSIIRDATRKLIAFTEEYPSYSNFEYLRREFQFLDKRIKEFYPDHRNDENFRSKIDEEIREIQEIINRIAMKLKSFYEEALQLLEKNGTQKKPQLPVTLNYNFVRSSEMYQRSSELCTTFRSRILSNASIINRPSYYLISILIFSWFSIRIFV